MNHNNYEIHNGSQQIIKSTFIMGSASVINIILGIIRHKIIAILTGASGIGLLGVYQSLSNLLVTIFGIGINESGARKIAQLYENNMRAVSWAYNIIRIIALLSGILGIVIVISFSKRLSLLTFKNSSHYLEISLLASTILLSNIFGAQTALIQGARRIKDLAKINILGPFFGTLFSLPLIYYFKERAIVSYLIVMAFTNVLYSWLYSKRIKRPIIQSHWKIYIKESKPLVQLGLAFMIGTIIGVATSYILRILIIRILGLAAAGIFQASTIFSSLYVGILFKSMATDFYPRLSAASDDEKACTKLVNEQLEAGILLATPGILFTITFSSFLLAVLYSRDFLSGVILLRWQLIGVMIQVVTWPMGYIMRAKGAGNLFIITEFSYYASWILFSYLGIKRYGLIGLGLAFVLSNLSYLIIIYSIIHKKYKIFISKANIIFLTFALSISTISFIINHFIPHYHWFLDLPMILLTSYYSYRKLNLLGWFSKAFNLKKGLHK